MLRDRSDVSEIRKELHGSWGRVTCDPRVTAAMISTSLAAPQSLYVASPETCLRLQISTPALDRMNTTYLCNLLAYES